MSGGLVYTGPQAPAVVLANDAFPAAVRVFDEKTVAEWLLAATSAEVVKICDDGSLDIANAVAVRLSLAIKAVDARDVELRAPLKNTMAAVREVTDRIREPLDRAKKALVNKIAAFDRDRKDAAERMRQEAQARHAAEVRKLQEDAWAKAKAERDAKEKEARELAEIMGETYAPPVESPPPAASAPTDFAKTVIANYPDVKPPAKVDAPAVSAGATMRRMPKLRITDFTKIPYKIGSEILMSPNEAAIMRCLQAGAKIEGAEIFYEDVATMRPTASAHPVKDKATGEDLF